MQEILNYSQILFFIMYCYAIYNKSHVQIRKIVFSSSIGAMLITIMHIVLDGENIFLFTILFFLVFVLLLKMIAGYNYCQILYTASIFITIYYFMYLLIFYFIHYQLQVLSMNYLIICALSLFSMQVFLLTIYSIKENIFLISRQKEGKLITVFSMSMMFVIPSLLSISPNLEDWNLMYFLTLLFMALVCIAGNVLIYYVIMVSKEVFIERQNIVSMQLEEVYKKKIEEEKEMLHKIRHDLKNHIIVIQKLLDMNHREEAIEHIQRLSNIVSKTEARVYTNSILIDAYINYIVEYNQDIHFTISSNDLSKISISHNDLLLLIMNLLDNAIENIDEHKSINVSFLFEDDQC